MTTAASAKPTGQYALFTDDPDRYPRSILSFGLGLDSIAILLRWITEPASRTFDFDDLAVVTAMTGDEYLSTSTTSKRSCCPKCAEGLSPTSDIAYGEIGWTIGVAEHRSCRIPHDDVGSCSAPVAMRWFSG